jgi:hypothetical protein
MLSGNQSTYLSKTDMIMTLTLTIFFANFAFTSFSIPTPYLSPGSSTPTPSEISSKQPKAIAKHSNITDYNIPNLKQTKKTNSLHIPNFSAIKDVTAKKQKFFGFLLPKIREANEEILENRNRLLAIRKKLSKNYRLDKIPLSS